MQDLEVERIFERVMRAETETLPSAALTLVVFAKRGYEYLCEYGIRPSELSVPVVVIWLICVLPNVRNVTLSVWESV